MNALIMMIDFEKCFETIDHGAIIGTFHYFRFGEAFIKQIMTLFNNFELCTTNNGFASRWMHPTCGVYQGCCISLHMFICTGQVFADILASNSKITLVIIVIIHDTINLLTQFADDTNLVFYGRSGQLGSKY